MRIIGGMLGLLALATTALGNDLSFEQHGWRLQLTESGGIASLKDPRGRELAVGAGKSLLSLAVVPAGEAAASQPAQAWVVCSRPARVQRTSNGLALDFDLNPRLPLRAGLTITLDSAAGLPVLKRIVTLTPTAPPLRRDLAVSLGNNLLPPGAHRVFTPRYNGLGEELENTPQRQWYWPLNGEGLLRPGAFEHLALPLISDAGDEPALRLTHIADRLFATSFQVAGRNGNEGRFGCVYPASRVPMNEPQERTFWTVLGTGGPDEAIRCWYATALADVPEGPDWLHEVAWQHYDYLSHAGRGWFEDIDAIEKAVLRPERSRIVMTLHGWYGLLGHYAFDAARERLDDEWTAFSNAEAVKADFPTSEPVRMTKAEMHRRLRYAKDRGFRVCIYFADGMGSCDGAPGFDPQQVLKWGGWVGPDTKGKSCLLNPAHPAVYARFTAYLKALLAEYGDEVDAFVWDETFHVPAGELGPAERPAYVAQAMMRLNAELTRMTTAQGSELAFLNSDCQGVSGDGKTFWTHVPPYSIVAHGCYQDSHCEPLTWPYGIFANLRNVLWSCNWQAVTRFDYTRYGVEHYAVPVATSNGWLDDKGFARLDEPQRRAVLGLFQQRKQVRQELEWLTAPPPAFVPGP